MSHLPVFKWAEEHLEEEQKTARCNDLMSMSALAVAGCGIALLPDDQFKPELVRLFSLNESLKSDIWILMHPDLRGCARLILFKKFLVEQLRNHPVFQQYGLQES